MDSRCGRGRELVGTSGGLSVGYLPATIDRRGVEGHQMTVDDVFYCGVGAHMGARAASMIIGAVVQLQRP